MMTNELFNPANYALSPYAVPVMVTTAALALLGGVVLIRERFSLISLLFSAVVITIDIWLFAFSWMYCSVNETVALTWAKIAYLGVPFIATAIYHFTVAVLGIYEKRKHLVRLGWLLSSFFSLTILTTDSLIHSLYQYWWGYYPKYGWLSIPYLTFFLGMLIMCLWDYWKEYRAARHAYEKKRIRSFLLAFGVCYIGSLDYLAKYGVPFYPFGYLAEFGFLLIAAWAIWKYRLKLTPEFAASQILETLQGAVLVVDLDGMVRVVNRAACRMLGHEQHEAVGKSLAMFAGAPVGLPLDDKLTTDFLVKNGPLQNYETTWQTRENKDLQVNISASILLDRDGLLAGVVYNAVDITERKSLENRMIQSEKIAAIGQLAAGVAHEINNPLGVILGFAQGAVRRLQKSDPLEMPLKSIEREALRCKQLVQDLLTFSRTGKTVWEKFNINEAIEGSLSLISAQSSVNKVKLVKKCGDHLPGILANRNQIQQVIVNLANNALDAMPQGGQLSIATQVFQENGHQYVQIHVQDTGQGIPFEIKDHIFDPFFTTKESGKGTGLGLSLVYEIVKKHNGEIRVDSHPGKGTAFDIFLPAAA